MNKKLILVIEKNEEIPGEGKDVENVISGDISQENLEKIHNSVRGYVESLASHDDPFNEESQLLKPGYSFFAGNNKPFTKIVDTYFPNTVDFADIYYDDEEHDVPSWLPKLNNKNTHFLLSVSDDKSFKYYSDMLQNIETS